MNFPPPVRCGLLLYTALLCLQAGPIPQQVVDPETAVVGTKTYSPNSVYGLWMAEYVTPGCSFCFVSPVMSGPRGLLNPGLELWFQGFQVGAVVNNAGGAALSWQTGGLDSTLFWFDYQNESAVWLETTHYYWPGWGPGSPDHLVQMDTAIYPLSITDTAITARVSGFTPDAEYRSGLIFRWDISGECIPGMDSGCYPRIIPEPSTYILIASGAVFLLACHRLRTRGSLGIHE